MRDDDVMWIPRLFVAGVVIAGFVIMIMGIFGSFRPMQLDMERRAEVHSPRQDGSPPLLSTLRRVPLMDLKLITDADDDVRCAPPDGDAGSPRSSSPETTTTEDLRRSRR